MPEAITRCERCSPAHRYEPGAVKPRNRVRVNVGLACRSGRSAERQAEVQLRCVGQGGWETCAEEAGSLAHRMMLLDGGVEAGPLVEEAVGEFGETVAVIDKREQGLFIGNTVRTCALFGQMLICAPFTHRLPPR